MYSWLVEAEMTGKRFRSLVVDSEEDDTYGEVVHPIGSTFVVGQAKWAILERKLMMHQAGQED